MGLKRKLVLCWLTVILAVAVCAACKNRRAESAETAGATPEKSTSESIAEADALYSQRKDLSSVRRGIIALRQARTHDTGNYEAAWKLARLDYFLGSHATDDAEKDAAFR